jgi:hypothetical protein
MAASAQHEHRGVAAVQRMVEYAPSSGGLALWVRHCDVGDADDPGGQRGAGAADTPGADLAARSGRADRSGRSERAQPAPRSVRADGSGDDDALAYNDGRIIFYRPGFEALSLPYQTGWVAHQVLHIALRHAPREAELRARLGDVDPRLFNLCADAIVNSALAHLAWLQLPPRAPTLERVLAEVLGQAVPAGESALLDWDVERLYAAVDDRRPASSGRSKGRPSASGTRPDGPKAARLRALGAGTASDLRPGAADTESPETEAEATREWGERLLRAHAGDGAHSMLRALLADLPRVRTPWEQVLRRQAAHALSQRPGLSWSRPTRSWIANQGRAGTGRRLPWEPGTTASQAVPRLVLVLDASGSVDDMLLARFAREVQALARRLEAELVLVVGDNAVREVHRFAPGRADLRELRFPHGGGTDFAPLIDEAVRHRPDLVVVLTDLDGPAGAAPRCPVLWAVPEAHAQSRVPFGRLLVLR